MLCNAMVLTGGVKSGHFNIMHEFAAKRVLRKSEEALQEAQEELNRHRLRSSAPDMQQGEAAAAGGLKGPSRSGSEQEDVRQQSVV